MLQRQQQCKCIPQRQKNLWKLMQALERLDIWKYTGGDEDAVYWAGA
jgi:hypothetical protein